MEANAPQAGSWNRRLRPPGPRAGARNLASLSPPAVAQSFHRGLADLNQNAPPLLTSALVRGQRGSAITSEEKKNVHMLLHV
eukprot:scaffold80060_cov75-Phaeocystis_antarctica.AAC.1